MWHAQCQGKTRKLNGEIASVNEYKRVILQYCINTDYIKISKSFIFCIFMYEFYMWEGYILYLLGKGGHLRVGLH